MQQAVFQQHFSAQSPTAFTVHDGAELRVLDQKGDWLQVSPIRAGSAGCTATRCSWCASRPR